MPESAIIDTPPTPASPARVELTPIEKLLIVRRRLGLTRAAAARRWKLSARAMRSWEEGTRSPRPATLERIAKIITKEKEGIR